MDMDLLKKKEKFTSLKMAELTGKSHRHVVRDIKDEISQIGEQISLSIFGLSDYKNSRGKKYHMYNMTKAGWLQLGARYDAKTRFTLISYADKLEGEVEKRYTMDEVVQTNELVNKYTFTDNQKQVHKDHGKKYVAQNKGNFGQFNNWRNEMLNIPVYKIDKAIKQVCIDNRLAIPKFKDKNAKINFLDTAINVKNAIWDDLQIKSSKQSMKLAKLGEHIVKKNELKVSKTNETNLFQTKKNINNKSLNK